MIEPDMTPSARAGITNLRNDLMVELLCGWGEYGYRARLKETLGGGTEPFGWGNRATLIMRQRYTANGSAPWGVLLPTAAGVGRGPARDEVGVHSRHSRSSTPATAQAFAKPTAGGPPSSVCIHFNLEARKPGIHAGLPASWLLNQFRSGA